MSAPTRFYRGKTIIYVGIDDAHHVVDAHWLEYLKLRKGRPSIVHSYSTLREMRVSLFKKGILV